MEESDLICYIDWFMTARSLVTDDYSYQKIIVYSNN